MAANIPTLKELYDQVLNDLESQFSITIPVFGPTFLRAFAAVQAGKLWSIYFMLGKVQKNTFVDTADPEASGGTLERWARIKLGRSPFPPTTGEYELTVEGTSGATIPSGTTFKSDDSSLNPGQLYILDNAYTLQSATDTINVRALESGVESRLESGDSLTSTSPLNSINDTATVNAELTEPQSGESLELYRQRALDSFRLDAQGGAAVDYRLWTQDAQGVRRVYPYTTSGEAGHVDVYVEATIQDSDDQKGTPTQAIKDRVLEVINFDPDDSLTLFRRGRRPLTVHQVNVLDVTVQDVDIELSGLSRSLTANEKTVVENAVRDSIREIRPHVDAANIEANRNDTLTVNGMIIVITGAFPSGVSFTDITVKLNNSSITSNQFTDGDIPYLNSITYL